MTPQIRRTTYLFFACHDGRFLDIEELLRGRVEVAPLRQLLAIPVLTGRVCSISEGDFDLIRSISSDGWVPLSDVEAERGRLLELARKGLLVTTEDEPLLASLLRRDEALRAGQWNVYAALYHSLTKWHDVDVHKAFGGGRAELVELTAEKEEMLEAFVERHGKPPPHFHARGDGTQVRELPVPERSEELYELLVKRKTTRVFDSERPVTAAELSQVLYFVFGCQGYVPVHEDVVALRKTSPSGGSLHPIEAYPLLTGVEGFESGLYHYRPENHALELVHALSPAEAERLAREFTAGQSYFASAQALIVLTARFYRSFWKYRKHQRAYAVILMDAGHLSQTFYLVCTGLGLGAFVTGAINGAKVEDALGLDGFQEGAIAVCGFGRPAVGKTALEPEFLPYVPRKTQI